MTELRTAQRPSTHSKSKTTDAVITRITRVTINLLIGGIIQIHRVQALLAVRARKTTAMPHSVLGDAHLRCIHCEPTSGTSETIFGLLANPDDSCTEIG